MFFKNLLFCCSILCWAPDEECILSRMVCHAALLIQSYFILCLLFVYLYILDNYLILYRDFSNDPWILLSILLCFFALIWVVFIVDSRQQAFKFHYEWHLCSELILSCLLRVHHPILMLNIFACSLHPYLTWGLMSYQLSISTNEKPALETTDQAQVDKVTWAKIF